VSVVAGGAYREELGVFQPEILRRLCRGIDGSPYFTTNTLNRDFVGTRGFSVVFRRAALGRVAADFPFFGPYLERVLVPEANAFYLNPLELQEGSRVDPHVDRSLRSYAPAVLPPVLVSVLYVDVPAGLRGGELVLQRGKKHVGRIRPAANKLVLFQGDLTHSIERVESPGRRLSLVCEQYQLEAQELELVPEYALETRAREYER
jgi:2-oxoglutarate-Fe(II)-dependent oxygenase superfamily protein